MRDIIYKVVKWCDYIEYYNNHQYQKRLNCMTPIEYRKHLACAA
ncbi:MAG: IS3 family transposase [Lachnospiraceae bacterium]|nr:IS3 family transposase [Lachnospiraceae bacterium]